MAGELTPDDGYALLQDTSPDMAMLRRKLLQRNALAQRNMAAMQPTPPIPGAGSITPDAVRARALGDYNRFGNGGVVLNQTAAQPDQFADTPEDIARKEAMSRMKLSSYGNRGKAGVGEVSGGGVDDWQVRRALQAKLSANANQRSGGMTRREQGDMARANRDSGLADANRRDALESFNKRNAERAYKRGALTPAAYQLAMAKGNLPNPMAGANADDPVAHLEGIYGRGNVPPEAYMQAMHEKAETARKLHETPDKAAMAAFMKHRMLQEAATAFGPDHPYTRSLMGQMGVNQPAPVAPSVAQPGLGGGDEVALSGRNPLVPVPAPTAKTKKGKTVYGNPYGPS